MIIHTVMQWVNNIVGRYITGLGRLFCLVALCVFFAPGIVWAEDAVLLFQKGKFEAARTAFKAIEKAKPNDPVVLYYLGRLTVEGALSRSYFQRVVNAHPQHDLADDAMFELVEVDYVQGLYVTARRKYRHLLETYPKTNKAAMVHYRIGLTFLAVKQADSALVAFDGVQPYSNETDVWSLARLGRLEALAQKGQTAEVVREAQAWLRDGAGHLDADVRAIIGKISPEDVPDAVTQVVTTKFWVQVAAFKNKAAAEDVKTRLEKDGFSVELGSKKNSQWAFVFVGPYATKAAAQAQVKQIDRLVRVKSKVTER